MLHNELNKIYKPLHDLSNQIKMILKEMGLVYKFCYFNNHSVLINNKYVTEYFPLPEFEILNITESCDLGISLDLSIWCEVTISRQKALEFDYRKITQFHFEVYGVNDYLMNFYVDTMDINSIKNLIENSNEEYIHIQMKMNEFDKKLFLDFLELVK